MAFNVTEKATKEKLTPAMEAKVTDHLWDVSDIAKIIDV